MRLGLNFLFLSIVLKLVLMLLPGRTKTVHGWLFSNHCRHNRRIYKIGDRFGHYYDTETDECIAYYCTILGKIPYRSRKCEVPTPATTTFVPPTSQTMTTPRTTTIPTTPPPPGCEYNGRFYQPDTMISSGRSGNWCYFAFCSIDSQVIHGDDFNCGSSIPTTPRTTIRKRLLTKTTTRPPPTTTPPPGCKYGGSVYAPETIIKSERYNNWCSVTYCNDQGEVIIGDNFNCGPGSTTTPRTTIPPTVMDRLLQVLERKLRKMT